MVRSPWACLYDSCECARYDGVELRDGNIPAPPYHKGCVCVVCEELVEAGLVVEGRLREAG